MYYIGCFHATQVQKKNLHSNDYLQEKVIFVTCEDDDKIADIQKLNGKYVRYFVSK